MQANIINIKTFDATVGTDISFDWSGEAITKINCVIKTNDSNSTEVYNETYESSNIIFAPYIYTIPANSGLVNGNTYNAFLRVYVDVWINDEHKQYWSDFQSLGTSFKCISTPTFEFSEISTIITNSNQTFYLNYGSNTTTGENLKSWLINIYDPSNNVIDTTGTRYYTGTPSSETISVELLYQTSGFASGVTYHIKAFGETESGMSIETESHYFRLEVPKDDQFYILQATNVACQGGIQLETYIAIVDAFLEKDMGRYIYDDNGDMIMLSTRNNTLSYKDGFALNGDFTISLVAADIDQNENIMNLTDSEFNRATEESTDPNLIVSLNYIKGYFGTPEEKGMFELVVNENGIKTVYFSNMIDPAVPEDMIQVTITRKAYKDDGGMWKLGARVVANDTRIYARHQELNVLTHKALEKYTHREIQLGYPLDYEDIDYENNYPGEGGE